ncbi:MAG: putative thioredoxin [Actinomycetota bacterium]|nr:putative thioredoxin [Actinomycetota bacterium]
MATNVPPISPSTLRGAVDLSGLVNPRPARPAASGVAGSPATDATFTATLELSKTVPVIVEFYGQGIEPVLGGLIAQYGGTLAHVVVDAPANPQLSQAFQVEQVPTVAAVIGGRPVQLYVGDYPEAEVRQVLDQVLVLAKEQGVTGTVPAGAAAAAEPAEEPLPPHHQEAFDAISAGDYTTAIAEYKTAIAQNPRDALAIAGLAQVSLLQRLDGTTADEIRAAAASGSLESQLALADLDVSFGDAAAAFGLLLDLFPSLDAAGKTAVRTRLLDYFEILGDDPLVAPARRRLTGLLF